MSEMDIMDLTTLENWIREREKLEKMRDELQPVIKEVIIGDLIIRFRRIADVWIRVDS